MGPPGRDRCPRCAAAFDCGAAGPAPCACTSVALPPALLAALRGRYAGCLCLVCLRALAEGAPVECGAPGPAPPTRPAAPARPTS